MIEIEENWLFPYETKETFARGQPDIFDEY